MTKIAVISKERGREIFGKVYADTMTFNPVLDKDMNIIISEQEVNQLDKKEYPWIETEVILKEPSEVLKTDWTKEQWLTYEKAEAEKRALELQAELDKIKKPIKK